MIDFYTSGTPNGSRVELILEELGLPYSKHMISLSRKENYSDDFLKLNPSARIPVIVDQPDNSNQSAITLTQSIAIMLYLAEKGGRFIPDHARAKATVMEWLLFDATDIATTRFDAFYLGFHLNHGGQASQVKKVLSNRVMEYYAVYDQRLSASRFLGGREYSIADIAAYPWAVSMQHPDYNKFIHIQRWLNEIEQRTAVQKVFNLKGENE